MAYSFILYVVALIAGLGWLEAHARLSARFGGGSRWRGLSAYGLFVLLLVLLAPRSTSLVPGVVAASSILAIGGWVATHQGLGSRGLLLAELAAFLCLVQGGIEIHFIQRPSGGYFFLQGWAPAVTILWFAAFVGMFRISRALPGLCEAVLALLSFILVGAVGLQRGVGADALAMAVLMSGVTTALWLQGHRGGHSERTHPVATSLWAMALAVLPVVTSIKRIAVLSLVTPLIVLVAPVLFFTYVMLTSYVAPNLASRNGARWAFRWNLSLERTVDLVMLLCLIGNLLVLVHAHTGNWLWSAGLAMLSMIVYWRLVSFVLLLDRTRHKSLAQGESIEILGVPLRVEGFDAILQRIERMIGDGRSHYIVTPDALSLLRTTQDEDYRRIVLEADLRVPDGAGVVWAADMLYESPLLERVPGVELVDRLAALAEQRGWSLYLLGARPEVLPAAVEALRKRHPALRIAGARDGFFDASQEETICQEISRLKPEILLVAMGVPRQEQWISRNIDRLGCSLLMGVGGTFDVLAGAVERAPLPLRRIGLEWLWRVAREPHRLGRILSLPHFVKEVLSEKLMREAAAEQEPEPIARVSARLEPEP